MAKEMRSAKAVISETVFCGDAEKEMKNAMTKDDDLYQLDLVHAARIAGFKLWEDKIMSLEELKTIVSKLEGVLYTLKKSVEKATTWRNGTRMTRIGRIFTDTKSVRIRVIRAIRVLSQLLWNFAPSAVKFSLCPLCSLWFFEPEDNKNFRFMEA